jgi:hypothetical protein
LQQPSKKLARVKGDPLPQRQKRFKRMDASSTAVLVEKDAQLPTFKKKEKARE